MPTDRSPSCYFYVKEKLMDGYRIATSADYQHIVSRMNSDERDAVLIHSLSLCDAPPVPLLEIVKAPFVAFSDRFLGWSPQGRAYELAIAENTVHDVDIREVGGCWQSPPSGSIQLLIKT